MRSMLGLPPSRLLPGRIVEIHDDLPDLFVGQAVLPRGHDGGPRRGFLRKSWPAFRDSPEELPLLEHGDRAGILKVGRRRVEAFGEVALAIEVVAMAVHAIADVRLAPGGHVLLEARLILPQWILGARDVQRLAAELNRVGRRRM